MSKFFTPTKYNNETKNQMWMSMIADGHDICCDCQTPFAHLLDSIFPEGHKDRDKPISYIIKRDWKQWHSTGDEEERTGGADGEEKPLQDVKQEEEGDGQEDTNVEELLAAVAAAEAR